MLQDPISNVQAEFVLFSSDVTAEYDIKNIEFCRKLIYAKLPSHEGAYISLWKQLEAKRGWGT